MSFEEYRCMIRSEDAVDEEYAVCQYPKCWLEDCPHKQARDRLAEAEKLPEKWLTADWSCLNDRIEVANWCADELKKALCGVGGGAQA